MEGDLQIPESAWMLSGAMEIMVRRKFDFLKHSKKLAPSVSRRTSSRVSTMAAILLSTLSGEYPSCFSDFEAPASLPLLRSHHGDLDDVRKLCAQQTKKLTLA